MRQGTKQGTRSWRQGIWGWRWSKYAAVGGTAVALLGCGEEAGNGATGGNDTTIAQDTGTGPQDSGGGGSDTGTTEQDTSGPAPGGTVEPLPLSVTIKVPNFENPNDPYQSKLSGVVLKPSTCNDIQPCPLIVVVGDHDVDPYPSYQAGATAMAKALPAVVVVFNLPGQGTGSFKSTGTDDIGGIWHQTAVKEVMHLKGAASYVDKTKKGFITVGSGLMPVAYTLKAFESSSLKDVAFLIDVEGPTDRCAISQAPQDDAKGIGPSDGPGMSDSACHFSGKAPHSAVYPAGKDGKPASIVCAEGAWPITKTGVTCQENQWWVQREPLTFLKDIPTRYQRVQFLHDHRLPSYWSSRLAYQAAAGSAKCKYFALNNIPPCTTLPTDEECGEACWLQGPFGNGLPPAPYAGGKLQPISHEALFTQVLPGYVNRMLTEPNCK